MLPSAQFFFPLPPRCSSPPPAIFVAGFHRAGPIGAPERGIDREGLGITVVTNVPEITKVRRELFILGQKETRSGLHTHTPEKSETERPPDRQAGRQARGGTTPHRCEAPLLFGGGA